MLLSLEKWFFQKRKCIYCALKFMNQAIPSSTLRLPTQQHAGSPQHTMDLSQLLWSPSSLCWVQHCPSVWVEFEYRMRRTHTQLKDGVIVLKLNSKSSSTTGFLGVGGLFVPVCRKVWGRMPKKKSVQSSITSMGFPLLYTSTEMCLVRQMQLLWDHACVSTLKRQSRY